MVVLSLKLCLYLKQCLYSHGLIRLYKHNIQNKINALLLHSEPEFSLQREVKSMCLNQANSTRHMNIMKEHGSAFACFCESVRKELVEFSLNPRENT